MAPEPNNIHNNNKDVHENMDGNIPVVITEEDLDEESSGDEENNTEYDGYKLLQQDEVPNNVVYSESESDDEDNIDGENTRNLEENNENINTDIDYQNLTCSGFGDDLPSTGLGFPEIISDDEEKTDIARDDNIEMNEDKVELVKNAMAGFMLPQSNIPDWAKNLSDDNWKESLTNSVNGNNQNK